MDVIDIVHKLIDEVGFPVGASVVLLIILYKFSNKLFKIFEIFIISIREITETFRKSLDTLVEKIVDMDRKDTEQMDQIAIRLQRIEDLEINLDHENQRLKDLVREVAGQPVIRAPENMMEAQPIESEPVVITKLAEQIPITTEEDHAN